MTDAPSIHRRGAHVLPPPRGRGEEGIVLIAVLVVAALAAMVAASLMFRMRAEVTAATAQTRGEQAYAAATAGVQTAIALLRAAPQDSTVWYDNPAAFRHVLVHDDGANRWYFTVYACNLDDAARGGSAGHRYGPASEGGKININFADEQTLLTLPGMTPELVDALLDYIDPDNTTRPRGAEQDYYDQLKHPYLIKNGPLNTLEELLLVRGFTGAIVYGEDANLNGLLEPNEDDGGQSFPPDNADGQLDTGLRHLATTFSSDTDVDSEGQPRIDLNAGGRPVQRLNLPEQTLRFIELYLAERQSGEPGFEHPSQLLEMTHTLRRDAPDGKSKAGELIESGVGAEQLPLVLDRLTTVRGSRRPAPLMGLVDVNMASVPVLVALGLEENDAQQIVEMREGLDARTKATPAWIYTQQVVDAETFKRIAPRLTARSAQFHVQCVGYGLPSGRFRVIEAVVDLSAASPRILYLRDLTRLGMPVVLDRAELGEAR